MMMMMLINRDHHHQHRSNQGPSNNEASGSINRHKDLGSSMDDGGDTDSADGWANSHRFRVAALVTALLLMTFSVLFLVIYFLILRGARTAGDLGRRGPSGILALPVLTAPWEPHCPATAANVPPPAERHDCLPDGDFVAAVRGSTTAAEAKCLERGCCWRPPPPAAESRGIRNRKQDKSFPPGTPHCIYPYNYGYVVSGPETQFLDGFEMPLVRLRTPSRYGDDAQLLRVRVEMQTPTRLRIKDPEIHWPASSSGGDGGSTWSRDHGQQRRRKPRSSGHMTRKLYAVSYNKSAIPFGLKVRRVDTGKIIFDTSVSGFTFGSQFVQITTRLPSNRIFGLGPLLPPSSSSSSSSKSPSPSGPTRSSNSSLEPWWTTWSIFTSDPSNRGSVEGYGGHPMYMGLEDDGHAHAVLLHTAYPLEMQSQPAPSLTYRVLGGSLDFYVFLGPTPEEVVQQYTLAIGKPFLPPYWMLGFQIDHTGAADLQAVRDSLRDVARSNISYDVVTLASEYQNRGLDFTVDHRAFSNLLLFTEEFARDSRQLDVQVDPALSAEQPEGTYPAYDDGERLGLFVNNSFGRTPLVGRTKSGKSVFVDFGHADVHRWWARNLERLRSIVRFQGLSLVGNQPSNWANGSLRGCFADNFNHPPYLPRSLRNSSMYSKTLCMDSWQWVDSGRRRVRHYAVHNRYGHTMAKVTHSAVSGLIPSERRVAIVSQSSTFVGSGKYTGFWATDVARNWEQLRHSVRTMLAFNLYGIPMVGSAVCGDADGGPPLHKDDELCIRWFQLGAFYPLFRMVHDPIFCDSGFGRTAKRAVETRYALLPYLYTLLFRAALQGHTVVRPLFHEFYEDKRTYNVTEQFLWGPALMVAPVLRKGVRLLDVYLPKGHWYIYHTGGRIISDGGWMPMEAPLERAIVLVRGGHILPTQPPGSTTLHSRKNAMHLVVALDEHHKASGVLFWDDGVTRDAHLNNEYVTTNFTVQQNKLKISGQKMKPTVHPSVTAAYFDSVDVLGLPYKPAIVAISGTSGVLGAHQFFWESRGKVMQLRKIRIPLTGTVEIVWKWTS